jgi:hypothetical protein
VRRSRFLRNDNKKSKGETRNSYGDDNKKDNGVSIFANAFVFLIPIPYSLFLSLPYCGGRGAKYPFFARTEYRGSSDCR